jgi:hypothetical protein
MTVITAAGGDQTATLNSAFSTASSAGQHVDLHGTFDIQTGDTLTYVDGVAWTGWPRFTGGDLTTDEVCLTIPSVTSGRICGRFDGEKTKDTAVAIAIKAGTSDPLVGFRDARVDVDVYGWKTGIDWVGWSCREFRARISACDTGISLHTANGMTAFLHLVQNNDAGLIQLSNCLTLQNTVIEGNVAGLEIDGATGTSNRSLVLNNLYFESNYSSGSTPSTGTNAALYVHDISDPVVWTAGQIGGSEVYFEDCDNLIILADPSMLTGGTMKVNNCTVTYGGGIYQGATRVPTKKYYGSTTTIYEP